jgi:tetratricopeptide (TPR) repeat protein
VDKASKQLFNEAIQLHDTGADGDKEAVVKAYNILQKLHQLHPDNQLVEAYYGSTLALLGRDAIDPLERFSKATKGLKILDRIVNSAPDNVRARILRAYVSYRVPEEFFHRTATAIGDFQELVRLYEEDNSLLSQKTYWQILYNLGVAYQRSGDNDAAQKVWAKLMDVTTDPHYKQLVQTLT